MQLCVTRRDGLKWSDMFAAEVISGVICRAVMPDFNRGDSDLCEGARLVDRELKLRLAGIFDVAQRGSHY